MADSASGAAVPIVLVVMGALYFLPAIAAEHRQHPNKGPITVVSLLLGWTGLAWILCLAWAFSGPDPDVLKTCPRCAERVQRAASACRFCGYDFKTRRAAVLAAPKDELYKGETIRIAPDGEAAWRGGRFSTVDEARAAVDRYTSWTPPGSS